MDTGITEGAALGPSKSPGGLRTATVGLVGLALAAGVATAAVLGLVAACAPGAPRA